MISSADVGGPTAGVEKRRFILPREHGSWGMLLFPFFSAAVLARNWSWDLAPALAATLAVFLAREPLAVLLRQRLVWKEPRPESAAARRTLVLTAAVGVIASLRLFAVVPAAWLFGLGAAAAVLTAAFVYALLNNLQRSVPLQIAGSLGLACSAVLAYLCAGKAPDEILILLVGVHALHNAGAVFTVHARLEAIQARRDPERGEGERKVAWAWQLVQGCAAAALLWPRGALPAAALALPVVVHVYDLVRFRDPAYLKVRLQAVGFRELGLSLVVSALVVAGLWRA